VTIKRALLIFIIALTVRVVYAWFFIDTSSLTHEDQALYINLGQNMAQTGEFLKIVGDGYTTDWVTSRVPGYPQFLAVIYTLFGENNMAVVWVQVIIDSLTCVVIGLIAESIVSRGFLIAGLISAINLNMIILSGMILTDTLFLFLFSLFILFAFNYLKHLTKLQLFLAVSFLSLATLVRSVSYFLIILLLLLLIFELVRRKVKLKQILYTVLIYLIPVVIALGPIHHRNYDKYSSFLLVSQGGKHTLKWVVPSVYQYSGQGSYQEGQLLAKDYFEDSMRRDNLQMVTNDPFKNSSYQMQAAKGLLTELGLLNMLQAWTVGAIINLISPSVAFAPIVREMDRPSFYATPGNGIINKMTNYVKNTNGFVYLLIITIGTIISLLFLILSIFGIYKMAKSSYSGKYNKEILIFSLFIVVYFMTITGPVVGVKYRLPIEPFMVLYFTYFLIYYLQIKTRKLEN